MAQHTVTYLSRWPSRHGDYPTPLVCVCADPLPERLDGIWWGLELYQCGDCGRKVVT